MDGRLSAELASYLVTAHILRHMNPTFPLVHIRNKSEKVDTTGPYIKGGMTSSHHFFVEFCSVEMLYSIDGFLAVSLTST